MWRLLRSPGDREQGAHAELLQVAALEHLDAELELARKLLRLLRKVGRGANVGGQVAQGFCELGAVGRGDGFREGLPVLGRRHQGKHDVCERRLGGFLLRLELVEAVEGIAHAEHGVSQVPGERARADPGIHKMQRGVAGAQLLQRVRGGADCVAVMRFRQILALSQADQQHALGGDAGQGAQEQRRAGLARQVAERLAQRAMRRLVDALRRRREFLAGVNSGHDAAASRSLGRLRLYAKLHGESIA